MQVWEIIANTPCLEPVHDWPELLCWALPSKRCHYDARAAPTTEVTSQQSFGAHRYRVRRKWQKGRGEIFTNACEVFGCEHVPSHVTKVPPDSAERLFFSERWLAKVSSEFYNVSTFKLWAGWRWGKLVQSVVRWFERAWGGHWEQACSIWVWARAPSSQHRSIVQRLTVADLWLAFRNIFYLPSLKLWWPSDALHIQWTQNYKCESHKIFEEWHMLITMFWMTKFAFKKYNFSL